MPTDDELWEELRSTQHWRYEQHERDAINDLYERKPQRSVWWWRAAFVIGFFVLLWAGSKNETGNYVGHEPRPTVPTTTQQFGVGIGLAGAQAAQSAKGTR